MAKRPEDAVADMIAGLATKTGKPMAEWLEIVRETGLDKHGQIVAALKSAHGIGHGYANLIALTFLKAPADANEDPIDALYSGTKAGLRPVHDAVVAALNALGDDVDFAPKKGYVSVRRNKQFAIIQPSTASRLDLGINLKGVAPDGRLEASGSFNAMLSHRVRLSAVGDVDEQLRDWLRQAYAAA